MAKEREEEVHLEIDRIKSNIQLHRPDIYALMLEEEKKEEQAQYVQVRPETEADLQAMVQQMKEMGLPLA